VGVTLLFLVLWCASIYKSFRYGRVIYCSIDSRTLHRNFWCSSTSRNVFVNWSQIEPSANGTWQPRAQVELDPLPLGFGFYVGGYFASDAGEVAIPYPLLLGLTLAPAAACYACRLRHQKQDRTGAFPISANPGPRQ